MDQSMNSRRRFLSAMGTSTAAVALALTHVNRANAEPQINPLHVLCTGPAGSIPDIVARRFAEQLNGRFVPTALVDNRPGAAGQIAINALKQAASDGNTVLLAPSAIATVYPYLYSKLSFDPAVDLQPVSVAGEMTLGLAIGPAVPNNVANLTDLLDWLRRNPKLANIGSPGIGTLPHLLPALLLQQAKVPWEHVVYAGGPPALANLMGGQIAALVLPEGLLRPHKLSGKLRILASSGASRTAYLPDVPTFVEQGFPNLIVGEWFAFFLSGRTSPGFADKLSQAIRQAATNPQLISSFDETGMLATTSTAAELAERIANEQRYWQPLIRDSGIRVQI